jgi:hypothetical protein
VFFFSFAFAGAAAADGAAPNNNNNNPEIFPLYSPFSPSPNHLTQAAAVVLFFLHL